MGKISDALERQQNERAINTKMLHPESSIQNPESRIQNPETSIQQPVPGILENVDPKLFTCTAPGSLEAENFKVLKGQLLFTKDGSRPRTILVTSALPGEGKTFVAANLAVSLAQGINEHALLIDSDFRRPRVHNMFGYTNQEGLQEYLTGKKELSDLLIRTKIDKLSLLTAGTRAPNPGELLSSTMMKELFDEFKARYHDRYIIIDAAPSHVVSEVNILANYVDCVIFVVMTGRSPRERIHECIENLGKDKVIGIVFNGYDKPVKTYDQYYRKYYKE